MSHVDLPEPGSWYEKFELPKHMHVNDSLFNELLELHPEQFGKVKMFGKTIDTPRYQQNYGQEYYYTGILHPANPVPHTYLQDLMNWVCEYSGNSYKQMIVNWYMHGNHYIGPHSDSERGLVKNSDIYSITLGPKSVRKFVIESKKTPKYTQTLVLKHHDVVIMGGTMQKYYKHSVPKIKAKDTRCNSGPRINITFRLLEEK